MASSASDEERSLDSVSTTDEDSPPNIIDVFKGSEFDEETKLKLHKEWIEILKGKDISQQFRKEFDGWFRKCYSFDKEQQKLRRRDLRDCLRERELGWFDEFQRMIDEVIDSAQPFEALTWQAMKKEIQERYRECPGEWVSKVASCVKKEIQLLQRLKKQAECVTAEAQSTEVVPLQESLMNLEDKRKGIENHLIQLKAALEQYGEFEKEFDTEEYKLTGTEMLGQILESSKTNGSALNLNKCITGRHRAVKHANDKMRRMKPEIDKIKQALLEEFYELRGDMRKHVDLLQAVVHQWRNLFKLQYVELKSNISVESIAAGCAQTGKQFEGVTKQVEEWGDLLDSWDDGRSPQENQQYQELKADVNSLFRQILQETFVVCDQDSYLVKMDKKCLPKVAVRVLAAESLNLKDRIEAYFCYEKAINECHTAEGGLDLQAVKQKGLKFKCGSSAHFKSDGHGRPAKGTFTNMKLEKFDRPKDKPVCEEKYRLVFCSTVMSYEVWTLSLPLVVTTGAIQGSQSLASVMWQCYSTDVFQLPIRDNDTLPWTTVVDMLKDKMKHLCPKHGLTQEHIDHLKHRLFGHKWQDFQDDAPVSLKQFCTERMEKVGEDEAPGALCNFSFWKWFIANYNLLEKYLLDYWRDGLIEGFISKQAAKKKLQSCTSYKNGIFLLRFSDSNITDSQGLKSAFGTVTAALASWNTDKATGQTGKIVHDVDLSGNHQHLKDKNLANILQETIDKTGKQVYQHLYPGDRSRDDAFGKYYKHGTVVDGYKEVVDAYIVNLEQQLSAMTIAGGKHKMVLTMETGHSESPQSPAERKPKPIKKARRSQTRSKPTSPASSTASTDDPGSVSQSHPVLRAALESPAAPAQKLETSPQPQHFYHEIDDTAALASTGIKQPFQTPSLSSVATATQPQFSDRSSMPILTMPRVVPQEPVSVLDRKTHVVQGGNWSDSTGRSSADAAVDQGQGQFTNIPLFGELMQSSQQPAITQTSAVGMQGAVSMATPVFSQCQQPVGPLATSQFQEAQPTFYQPPSMATQQSQYFPPVTGAEMSELNQIIQENMDPRFAKSLIQLSQATMMRSNPAPTSTDAEHQRDSLTFDPDMEMEDNVDSATLVQGMTVFDSVDQLNTPHPPDNTY